MTTTDQTPGLLCQELPVSEAEILTWAEAILRARFARANYLTSPALVRDYLRLNLGAQEREVFGVILLDSQHGVLRFERLFYGTMCQRVSPGDRQALPAAQRSRCGAGAQPSERQPRAQ